MDYQVKLFHHFDEDLKLNWRNLEKDSYHNCFNSLAWVENYASSFKKSMNDFQLRVFVIFHKDRPICIFPFEIIKKYKINILKWAGDAKSDFNKPIQKKNFSFEKESFKLIWNKILQMMPELDLIYLKNQINFSESLNNPLVNILKNLKEGVIYQITLPDKWKDYTNTVIKKKFYSDLMSTKRLIKKYGKVEFLIAKNSEEKKIFLNFLIKQKRENLEKLNIDTFSENDLNFYKNFEKYDDKKYITQASAIKLNGEFIAMHWGIIIDDYYYYLLPSIKSQSFKKFSPGKLLLSLLIRWSISKKLKFFDFGLGEESYKQKWTNKKTHVYSYIKLSKFRGIIFYAMLHIKQTIKYLKGVIK